MSKSQIIVLIIIYHHHKLVYLICINVDRDYYTAVSIGWINGKMSGPRFWVQG
jgi:hypothetical protein